MSTFENHGDQKIFEGTLAKCDASRPPCPSKMAKEANSNEFFRSN